jgi:hypothetical protein
VTHLQLLVLKKQCLLPLEHPDARLAPRVLCDTAPRVANSRGYGAFEENSTPSTVTLLLKTACTLALRVGGPCDSTLHSGILTCSARSHAGQRDVE